VDRYSVQIERENGQLENGRACVLLVEEQHPYIFVAHVDFRGVLLPEPRDHTDALGVEFAFEVGVELLDIRTSSGSIAQGDLYLEIVGPLVVLLVLIESERAHALLADKNVGGISFRRHDVDARVAEQPLEIGLELLDFPNVHGSRPLAQPSSSSNR
jgi:hypothetical protein